MSRVASPAEYPAIVEWLYGLRLFGAKLGLENVRRLANLAGDPQDRLRFVHVAGTNGKGSTCAMLESIYRQAGLRTGLFTSPHLVSFRERIQVDRRLIAETDVVRLVREIEPWLQTFSQERHPTFFEVVTVLALRYFVEQKCQVVIWETGMGGRLDATNIVQPEAAVITNIQLDHEKWLGQTLEAIAAEKAGIIKSGVPVITTAAPAAGLEIIRATAQERGAPLTALTDPGQDLQELMPGVRLPLLGDHQAANAALALQTVRVLHFRWPVTLAQARQGLETVRWDGRMQRLRLPSGQQILLDGAHNPAGAAALARAVDSLLPTGRGLVLGLLQEKDADGMCALLAPLADRIWAVRIDSERSALPETVAAACRRANPAAEIEVCGSVRQALDLAGSMPALLVTGSLHLVGAALQQLNLAGANQGEERRLNDYSMK